jgi:hypothetical protein
LIGGESTEFVPLGNHNTSTVSNDNNTQIETLNMMDEQNEPAVHNYFEEDNASRLMNKGEKKKGDGDAHFRQNSPYYK